MGWTVNPWLVEFDSLMRSKEVFTVSYVAKLEDETVLGGSLNRPAYIVGGNRRNYTQVTAGSTPAV